MFLDKLNHNVWLSTPGARTAFGPFLGAAETLCIAELASQTLPLAIVTPSISSARTIERELRLFLDPDVEVLTLPDWETLPYDHFSPHQDIVSERLDVFHRLPALRRGIVLIPITTLMLRTPPVHYVSGNSLVLALGDQFMLQQRDVVYVTAAPITRWNRWVSNVLPSLQGLFNIDRIGSN